MNLALAVLHVHISLHTHRTQPIVSRACILSPMFDFILIAHKFTPVIWLASSPVGSIQIPTIFRIIGFPGLTITLQTYGHQPGEQQVFEMHCRILSVEVRE
jgi:hypothetical protein